MKAYAAFAKIYDHWQEAMGTPFSHLILPKLDRAVEKHHIKIDSMVDVACGTGILAIAMAERGIRTFGIDLSEEMLKRAKAKVRGRKLPLTLSCQDMRSFRLPTGVELATCFFNSLNHLLALEDLLNTFRCVHRALKNGGFFIFDLNNRQCFEALWTKTSIAHQEDFTLIMENHFDPGNRRARAFLTIFQREGRAFRRDQDVIQERWFLDGEVRRALRRAGFQVVEKENFNPFRNLPFKGLKGFWVCRKVAKGEGGPASSQKPSPQASSPSSSPGSSSKTSNPSGSSPSFWRYVRAAASPGKVRDGWANERE